MSAFPTPLPALFPTLPTLPGLPAHNALRPAVRSIWPLIEPEQAEEARQIDEEFSRRRPATPAQIERRKRPRLDPNDPETYEQLRPTVERVKQQAGKGEQALRAVMDVLDVVDAPRMMVNKLLNLVIRAKSSSPDPSILGGKRIYGADVMERFGIKNTAAKLIGGFLWDVVTDPLTWLTGFGGVLRAAGKIAVGKTAATVGAKVAQEAAKTATEKGVGTMLQGLARRGRINLASLESVTEAARRAGKTDELHAILQAAAPQPSGTAVGGLFARTKANSQVAELLNTVAKEGGDLGGVLNEVANRGRLVRRGLRLSNEPLRQLPLLGRAVRKLPGFRAVLNAFRHR